MAANHSNTTYYSITEVAAQANVSRDTLLRWLKAGKIPEPSRNRNNYRIFTEQECAAVVRFANQITPSPLKRQTDHFKARVR
jgi:excisionase family DNA binding protein